MCTPAPLQLRVPEPLPTIAVSMGDPGGIGPEVLVKALADPDRRRRARWVLIGCDAPLALAAERAGITAYWRGDDAHVSLIDDRDVLARDPFPPSPNPRAGELSYRWVREAIRRAQRAAHDPDRAHAIVTGPISKHAWTLAGHSRYPGHTELLADAFGLLGPPPGRFGMMFHTPRLKVILATAHLPLSRVGPTLTLGLIYDKIALGHEACRRLGIDRPRIAVCGLNPHAGEEGLLGTEDRDVIFPAIEAAREEGFDASGPHPGDTVFLAALAGRYDLVVAMYHDQGLIPVKLLDRDRAVNVTVGLPVPRTSPDHGTAFDIAGTNAAHPGSMAAALDLAARLAATDEAHHP